MSNLNSVTEQPYYEDTLMTAVLFSNCLDPTADTAKCVMFLFADFQWQHLKLHGDKLFFILYNLSLYYFCEWNSGTGSLIEQFRDVKCIFIRWKWTYTTSLSKGFCWIRLQNLKIRKLKCPSLWSNQNVRLCLTRLPSAFLRVCVYRGVRPPGAKMVETSGTLGVTERERVWGESGDWLKYEALSY